jgi:hypothetical protein
MKYVRTPGLLIDLRFHPGPTRRASPAGPGLPTIHRIHSGLLQES